MHLKRLTALLVGTVVSASAAANAVYEWVNVAPSSTIRFVEGQLVVTDEAYAAGSVSFTYIDSAGGPPIITFSTPSSPIVEFTFTPHSQPNPSDDPTVDYHWAGFYIPGGAGIRLTGNLQFVDDKIGGNLIAESSYGESNNALGGNPELWTIYQVGGYGCRWHWCSEATGYWQRVPEPATASLLTLGLLGLGAIRGRRRTKS